MWLSHLPHSEFGLGTLRDHPDQDLRLVLKVAHDVFPFLFIWHYSFFRLCHLLLLLQLANSDIRFVNINQIISQSVTFREQDLFLVLSMNYLVKCERHACRSVMHSLKLQHLFIPYVMSLLQDIRSLDSSSTMVRARTEVEVLCEMEWCWHRTHQRVASSLSCKVRQHPLIIIVLIRTIVH